KVKASSSSLFSVSHVIFICRQQPSSLKTASSSLMSFNHCSRSSFEFIFLSSRSIKKGSSFSHVVTVKSFGKKWRGSFFISAEYIIRLIYKWANMQIKGQRHFHISKLSLI